MVPLQSPCKTENNDAPSVVAEGAAIAGAGVVVVVAAGVGVVVEADRGGEVELGVADTGVVVVVAAGVGVVVEADRGGEVELEEVMFVGAHKTEGP